MVSCKTTEMTAMTSPLPRFPFFFLEFAFAKLAFHFNAGTHTYRGRPNKPLIIAGGRNKIGALQRGESGGFRPL